NCGCRRGRTTALGGRRGRRASRARARADARRHREPLDWSLCRMSSPNVASSPAEVITALASALRDGCVADALALYEPDAVFVPKPAAPPIAGRIAIQEALSQFAALQPRMSSNIRSVVVAGDVATVINDWQLTGIAPDGSRV